MTAALPDWDEAGAAAPVERIGGAPERGSPTRCEPPNRAAFDARLNPLRLRYRHDGRPAASEARPPHQPRPTSAQCSSLARRGRVGRQKPVTGTCDRGKGTTKSARVSAIADPARHLREVTDVAAAEITPTRGTADGGRPLERGCCAQSAGRLDHQLQPLQQIEHRPQQHGIADRPMSLTCCSTRGKVSVPSDGVRARPPPSSGCAPSAVAWSERPVASSAAAGSTPITLQAGAIACAASAVPESRPPPPHGRERKSSVRLLRSAHGPCPAGRR